MKLLRILPLFLIVSACTEEQPAPPKNSSPQIHKETWPPEKNTCKMVDLYSSEEILPGGIRNLFYGVLNFNEKDKSCWFTLAEDYSNIVPPQGIKEQNIYYISAKDTNDKITTQDAYNKSDKAKAETILIVRTDSNTIKSKTSFPYRKGR